MNTQLEDRVREALAWRADHTTIDPAVSFQRRRPPAALPVDRRGRAWRIPVAAVAALALVVAGVVAVALTRGDQPPDAAVATAPPSTVTSPAGDGSGRLGVPTGSPWVVTSADELVAAADRFASNYPTRIYATDAAEPENGPALIVTATPVPDEADELPRPDGARDVVVQGEDGLIVANPGGSIDLWFRADGLDYQLTALNLTEGQLLTAAASAAPSPDGNGALVHAATLPSGVTEQAVGWRESMFASIAASEQPAPRVSFTDATGLTSVTYLSFADPAVGRLSRLLFDDVTPTTVNGAPGYIGTMRGFVFTAIVWSTETRTMFLMADGSVSDELLALAESLVPVTDAEWAAMEAAADNPQITNCAPATDSPTTACVAPPG